MIATGGIFRGLSSGSGDFYERYGNLVPAEILDGMAKGARMPDGVTTQIVEAEFERALQLTPAHLCLP